MRPETAVALRVSAWSVSAGASGALIGLVISAFVQSDVGLWLLARSTGIASYLLLTAVTILGLLLSGPRRVHARVSRGPGTHRLGAHSALALFVLVLTGVHIVVLALDPWAKVGWAGALLPFGAQYRPLAVTLGLLAFWSALLSGVTAALAGRVGGRIWSKLHAVAGIAWLLAWLHGLLAGSDTGALVAMYVVTGIAVLAVGMWRYTARSTADVLHARSEQLRVDR